MEKMTKKERWQEMIGVGGKTVKTYRAEVVLNEGRVEIRRYRGDGHSERLESIETVKEVADPEDVLKGDWVSA
jgi:hypothetical protein